MLYLIKNRNRAYPYILFHGIILICLISCSTDSNDSPENKFKDFDPVITFSDNLGDAYGDFMDLKKMKIGFSDNQILISIEVADLPSALIFNHDSLEDNNLNYSWEINFDVDSLPSFYGDLKIATVRWKEPGIAEFTGDILSNTITNLYKGFREESRAGFRYVADIDLEIEKNTFYFQFYREQADSLFDKINQNTPIFFNTSYRNGNIHSEDQYPDYMAY